MAASARWWAASPNRRRPAEAPVSRLNPRDPGRRRWLLAGLGWWAAGGVLAAEPPALMLAHTFRPDTPLAGFFVSEKLDGVRARWDGQRLLTRGGEVIAAPAWFTAGWPEQSLDGELWMGRGRFEDTVSTVRSLQTDRAGWQGVHFMVFDAPDPPRATAATQTPARPDAGSCHPARPAGAPPARTGQTGWDAGRPSPTDAATTR